MSQNEGVIAQPQPKASERVDQQLDEADQIDNRNVDLGRTSEELPLDVIFELLKNQRRRHLLRYLQEKEGPVSLGELAEHVAALENNTTVNALTSSQRKRVYVGLYQCHLPKMDDSGVIDFNRDRGIIELNESASQLEKYLEYDDNTNRQWHIYYLSLAGGGGVLYGTSVALLSAGHPVANGIVVALIGTFVAFALIQFYEESREE